MPLQKVTLNLQAGDFDKMRSIYPKIGAGKAIRALVRKHIERVEQTVGIPDLSGLEEVLNDNGA